MRGATTTEYIIIIAVALVIGVIAASLLGVFPTGATENAGAVDRSTGTPFGVVGSNKIEGGLTVKTVLQNNDGRPHVIRGVVAESDGKKYVTNYDPNIVFDAGGRQTLEFGVPDTLEGSEYSYGLNVLYDDSNSQETDVEGDTGTGNGFGVGRICSDSAQCTTGLICIPSSADGMIRCRQVSGFCARSEECASLYCQFNMCTDRPPGSCSPICKAGSPTTICLESLEWCGPWEIWASEHQTCSVSGSCNGEYAPCVQSCGGPACKDVGGGCIFGYECCSNECDSNNKCACREEGVDCTPETQCCGNLACTNGKCSACKETGQTCNGYDSDCCQRSVAQNCNFVISEGGAGSWACLTCKGTGESCSMEQGVRDCCGAMACANGFCGAVPEPCAQNGESCNSIPCCQSPDKQSCEVINGAKTCALECGSTGDACGGQGMLDCCGTLTCTETGNGKQCYPNNFVCREVGDGCDSTIDCCQDPGAPAICAYSQAAQKNVCTICSAQGKQCEVMPCCGSLICSSGTGGALCYSQGEIPDGGSCEQSSWCASGYCTADPENCQNGECPPAGSGVCACRSKGVACKDGQACCDGLACKDNACQEIACGAQGVKCDKGIQCCSGICLDGGCVCLDERKECVNDENCCQSPAAQVCAFSESAGKSICQACGTEGKECNVLAEKPCCGGLSCKEGKCSLAQTCSARGENCGKTSNCCSGVCAEGTCICTPKGEKCAADADCCGKVCTDGICKEDASCPEMGCASDLECQKYCGLQYCAAGGMCAPQCKGTGSGCGQNSDCCYGLACKNNMCVPEGCNEEGKECASDLECCSGYCSLDGVCKIKSICTPKGDPCESDADCCQDQEALICHGTVVPGGGAAPVEVCTPETTCSADGAACGANGACCSNRCSTGPSGTGVCVCAQNSNSCTSGTQCCSGNCAGGWCLGRLNGQTCSAGNQCDSQYCNANGMCACKPAGVSCSGTSQCCGGLECNVVCQAPPPPTCTYEGQGCTATSECCQSPAAQVCAFSESAGKSICQACGTEGNECDILSPPCCGALSCTGGICKAQSCQAEGSSCHVNSDCCQNINELVCDNFKCSKCPPLGERCRPDATPCCSGSVCYGSTCKQCYYEEDTCGEDYQCCGGVCEGGKCATCRQTGYCGQDSDCCSGNCDEIKTECVNSPSCVSTVGARCRTNGMECCTPLECKSNFAMVYTCQEPAGCVARGASCATNPTCCTSGDYCDSASKLCLACKDDGKSCKKDAECCMGACNSASGTCGVAEAVSCRQKGESCTVTGDCCSGQGLVCLQNMCGVLSVG